MGNITSYFSGKESLEEYIIGQTDEKIVNGSQHTPTRFGKPMSANQLFDPRSPTFDIDRTPIVVSLKISLYCYNVFKMCTLFVAV